MSVLKATGIPIQLITKVLIQASLRSFQTVGQVYFQNATT